MKNALLSVYHKEGVVEFARRLIQLNFRIYASGGTARHLRAAGVNVTDISTLVGGGPMLGHRVVTLSREIHAGLLARLDSMDDMSEVAKKNIPLIHLVCVDLYPLEAEMQREGRTIESIIELTDIGGPALLRSAAKGRRIVIADRGDWDEVLYHLTECQGDLPPEYRDRLAAKAEYLVAEYCLASAQARGGDRYAGLIGGKVRDCQYGENGWQAPAALYSTGSDDPLALPRFQLVAGTDPSYNNWCDVDRALQTLTHITAAYAANAGVTTRIAIGVKHGNACGAAALPNKVEALRRMLAGDPEAIFGGLVMVNFDITDELAQLLAGKLLDGVVAPSFSEGAIELLRRKHDKCRFFVNPALKEWCGLDQGPRLRQVRGGFLAQSNYTFVLKLNAEEMRKYGTATAMQEDDLALAWAIGSTSTSNTITIVREGQLLANAVGQQSRVESARLAVGRAERAGHTQLLQGSVAYSDSFFPFTDGPQVLISSGVKAILTSSGSIRDEEVIEVCKRAGVALYMIPDKLGRGFYGH